MLTALAIGSMIPDWPLFVPLGPDYATTHSFSGIFLSCLPLGLAVTLLFIGLMKRPLFELMPAGLRRRMARYMDAPRLDDVRVISGLAIAVVAGASSHVIWDAFTHGGAWGVAMFPELREVWMSVAGVRFPGYVVLQHGSSVIGLPVLLAMLIHWYVKAPSVEPSETLLSPTARVVWLLVIVGIPIGILINYLGNIEREGLRPVVLALYFGVTEGGFAFLALTTGYTLLFFPVLRLGKRPEPVD